MEELLEVTVALEVMSAVDLSEYVAVTLYDVFWPARIELLVTEIAILDKVNSFFA